MYTGIYIIIIIEKGNDSSTDAAASFVSVRRQSCSFWCVLVERRCICHEFVRAKLGPDGDPHVGRGQNLLEQKPSQFEQFAIVGTVEPAFNWYAIVDLVTKSVRAVVDQDCLGQIATQHVQVLQVVAFHRETRLPEETVVNVLLLCVTSKQTKKRTSVVLCVRARKKSILTTTWLLIRKTSA